MVKKLFFIAVLSIAIIYGVLYLQNDAERAVTFSVDDDIKPIIILADDDLMVSAGEAFYPENFISVYHPGACTLVVDKSFDTGKTGTYDIDILVTCGETSATATMRLEVVAKEVEVVTIEKVVTEYITIADSDDKTDEKETVSQQEDTTPFFYGHHDISLPSGSSVSTLIQALSADVVTNVQVTIDYAEVDLSHTGTYKAYYYTEIGSYSVLVTIY